MSAGEAAGSAGVSVKALRYYEAGGLLRPARRANGYRDYTERDVRLACEIRAAPAVLVDSGATSLTALRQQEIDPNQIQTVLVSHLHGDHFGDLPFLVLDGQFRGRTHDLTVLGPPGTRTRLEQAMEILLPGSSSVPRRFAVEVVEHVNRGTLELGPLRVTAYDFQLSDLPTRNGRSGGTRLAYHGEIRADLWQLGAWWADKVAAAWERVVRETIAAVQAEAQRRHVMSAPPR